MGGSILKRIPTPRRRDYKPTKAAILDSQDQRNRTEWLRSIVDIDRETTAHGNRTNDTADYLSVRIQR